MVIRVECAVGVATLPFFIAFLFQCQALLIINHQMTLITKFIMCQKACFLTRSKNDVNSVSKHLKCNFEIYCFCGILFDID